MEAFERDDRAVARLDPEQLVGIPAVGHREDAGRIALEEQARVEATIAFPIQPLDAVSVR